MTLRRLNKSTLLLLRYTSNVITSGHTINQCFLTSGHQNLYYSDEWVFFCFVGPQLPNDENHWHKVKVLKERCLFETIGRGPMGLKKRR